jgi:hypothetical protein
MRTRTHAPMQTPTPLPMQKKPSTYPQPELEAALVLADKYDMQCVKERCLAALLDPRREWALEGESAAAPPGAGLLRWLALTHRLHLPALQAHLLREIQARLPAFARDAGAQREALGAAAAALDRPALLQLLGAALDGAAAAQPQPPQAQPQASAQSPQPSGGEPDLVCALQALMGGCGGADPPGDCCEGVATSGEGPAAGASDNGTAAPAHTTAAAAPVDWAASSPYGAGGRCGAAAAAAQQAALASAAFITDAADVDAALGGLFGEAACAFAAPCAAFGEGAARKRQRFWPAAEGERAPRCSAEQEAVWMQLQ